jgi:TolB protein
MNLPKGKIVFSSDIDGDNEIYIMNINGTNRKQLTRNLYTKTNTATDADPSFSFDGNTIVFRSSRLKEGDYKIITNFEGRAIGESFSGGSSDIFIMDSDGNHQTPLTYKKLCRDPFFSPDGEKVIFISNRPSFVGMIDLNSQEQRILNQGGGQFEFSKDSMKIFNNLNYGISVMDITGLNKKRLISLPESQNPQGTRRMPRGLEFALSPDGKQIALVTMEVKNNYSYQIFKFYTMNIDGSDLKEIKRLETDGSGTFYSFKYTPDGNSVIFNLDSGQACLYLLNLVNGNITDLTTGKEMWDSSSDFKFSFHQLAFIFFNNQSKGVYTPFKVAKLL